MIIDMNFPEEFEKCVEFRDPAASHNAPPEIAIVMATQHCEAVSSIFPGAAAFTPMRSHCSNRIDVVPCNSFL